MLDNCLDRQVNIGLVEVGSVPGIEALPLTSVDRILRVDPELGFVVVLQGSIVEKVLTNEVKFFGLFLVIVGGT